MDMPTASAGAAATSMPMSSSQMSMMQMTFFTSTNTPLWSAHWTPSNTGTYAGTCIFLVGLAIALRLLFIGKHLLEERWTDHELNRRVAVVQGGPTERELEERKAGRKILSLMTERGIEEEVEVVRRHAKAVTPFRLSVDVPRALYMTVVIAISYLLMLAVMTYNIGYFLSVLCGSFLGEVVAGRYTHLSEH